MLRLRCFVEYNDVSITVASVNIILLIYSTASGSLSKYLINVCAVYRDVMTMSIFLATDDASWFFWTENLTIQPFLTIG